MKGNWPFLSISSFKMDPFHKYYITVCFSAFLWFITSNSLSLFCFVSFLWCVCLKVAMFVQVTQWWLWSFIVLYCVFGSLPASRPLFLNLTFALFDLDYCRPLIKNGYPQMGFNHVGQPLPPQKAGHLNSLTVHLIAVWVFSSNVTCSLPTSWRPTEKTQLNVPSY